MALTSLYGNEYCLTRWNVLYPSSERESGLVCKLKYCLEKSVASNDRKFFLSNPALWSFVGHAVDSRLRPAVGLGHALAFCDGAQSWLFVMAKRQKALHS